MSTSDDISVPTSCEMLVSAITSISHKIMLLYSQAVFRETGLNWQDWRILRAVVALQSCRAQDICEESGLKKPHVSNGLARLEKAGHISRQTTPGNARIKIVTSTEQGKSLVQEAAPALEKINSQLALAGTDMDPAQVIEGLRSYEDELGRLVGGKPPDKPARSEGD